MKRWQVLNPDGTREMRLFIRMIDIFFDYLNVKSVMLSDFKRKDSIAPYASLSDERFKVSLSIIAARLSL